jgi:Leucine-rich repeat (LRR) protein
MLRELHLCNNNINKLEFNASAIINLNKLLLTNNQIKDISVLEELRLLSVLNLSSNKIDGFDALCTLTQLYRLDLSMNSSKQAATKLPLSLERSFNSTDYANCTSTTTKYKLYPPNCRNSATSPSSPSTATNSKFYPQN